MDLNAATFIKAMVSITAFTNIHRTTIADHDSLVKALTIYVNYFEHPDVSV